MEKIPKGLFVVGTDTDVGKTYVSALLMKKLLEYDINAAYFKGALSGAEEVDGKLIPSDAEYVCRISGLKEDYKNMVSYSFKTPVSPHLASRLEKQEILTNKILLDYKKLCNRYEYILAEGSGGIICPIKITDNENIFLEDIIKAFGYEVIIVARSGVGTINHTCLTIHYIKSKGIKIRGIIFNKYDKNHIAHQDNTQLIEQITGVSILAYVPKEAEDIDVDIHLLL